MPEREPLRVAMALVWSDNRLVVGRRGPGKALAGFHEFPGGKCEPGETPELTALRECKEETGLDVRCINLRNVTRFEYSHGLLMMHFFDCEWEGDPAIDLPSPFQWRSLKEVLALDFPPGNHEVLASLRLHASNE